jgi:hypothetical protein
MFAPAGKEIQHMVRKTKSIRRQKGVTGPTAAKKEAAATKSAKGDEGWGPIGAVAKKAGKGAVKGAAKELLK